MILAESYIGARMKLGPPLANYDVTGKDQLTTVALDSKSFGFGIATVLGTAACFLVCHIYAPRD
jgi:hypothetical protein